VALASCDCGVEEEEEEEERGEKGWAEVVLLLLRRQRRREVRVRVWVGRCMVWGACGVWVYRLRDAGLWKGQKKVVFSYQSAARLVE
jgi:hypothetical protein